MKIKEKANANKLLCNKNFKFRKLTDRNSLRLCLFVYCVVLFANKMCGYRTEIHLKSVQGLRN